MTVSYNRRKKVRKMINRIQQMTVEQYKKLRPEEVKTHQKIVEFMKEHNILPKLS